MWGGWGGVGGCHTAIKTNLSSQLDWYWTCQLELSLAISSNQFSPYNLNSSSQKISWNVGVPTLCFFNVGTVTTLCILNAGTVPSLRLKNSFLYPLFCYIFWGQFLRLEPIHNIKTNTISNGFDTILSKGSNNTGGVRNLPRVLLFHGALEPQNHSILQQ